MKRSFNFKSVEPAPNITMEHWLDWKWQLKHALKTHEDFLNYFALTQTEDLALKKGHAHFRFQTTPYYAALANRENADCPIRKTSVPQINEFNEAPAQQMLDPLGEKNNRPSDRIIHRYPDRALFWLTDQCSVYCRYCTRKHFTASNQSKASEDKLNEAVKYVTAHPEIREIIFSGGDPLVVSDDALLAAVEAFYKIPHVELIRLGTRVPVVLPMRVTAALLLELKKFQPVYWMTHFNHPDELSNLSAERLEIIVDHGFPVFNQMVLLNGINNHPAIVQALSRRLLSLRVKPYYMFQCDPSEGSDHFRTSIADSLKIQKELWGKISGLMMPNFSLDIPGGGGKVGFTPSFSNSTDNSWQNLTNEAVTHFCGFDGVSGAYINPPMDTIKQPMVSDIYLEEWARLQSKMQLT